jgi:hypothetical protein
VRGRTVAIHHGKIGTAALFTTDQHVLYVHARARRRIEQEATDGIVANHGKERGMDAQPREVLGNVARHAADAETDCARRRGAGHQRTAWLALGIDRHSPDHEHRGGIATRLTGIIRHSVSPSLSACQVDSS